MRKDKRDMQKLINKLVILSAIALLTPGLSYAALYVGLGTGQTNIETENADCSGACDPVFTYDYVVDDNDTSFKLFGGWRVTPAFALEFGYIDLGKYTVKLNSPGYNWNLSSEATALFFEGVGSVDLGSGWRFLGKLGIAYWDGTVDYHDSLSFTGSGSDSGLDPVIGLGFEYGVKFGRTRMGIRLEWEQYQNVWEDVSYKYDISTTETFNGVDINTFGIAVTYDF